MLQKYHILLYEGRMCYCCVFFIDLELMGVKCKSQSRIAVHSVQILPQKSFRENESNEVVTIEPDGCTELALKAVVRNTHVYFMYTRIYLKYHISHFWDYLRTSLILLFSYTCLPGKTKYCWLDHVHSAARYTCV